MEGSNYSTRKSQPALPKHVRCNLKQGMSLQGGQGQQSVDMTTPGTCEGV